ncbi:unnamed protein product [Haemonchus placei]|uniref:Metalloendopeptidase n=1 Tax=Haemonchus placei TaxID=6290 RepID=A0A0N4X9N3_HAEPC|nr:unnamed protein product [Haemonchus placei]
MIGVLLLLMVLFENSFCLSEKGRIALTKAYGGMDIEKCHERLKKFGRKGWRRKTAPEAIPYVKEETNPATEEDKNATNEKLDLVLTNGGSIEKVNQMEGVDEYLFDGDMILTEEQMAAYEKSVGKRTRKKRQISSNATRWDNNTVFYYFDGSITARNQAYIKTVLKYLSARTCIDFVENMTAPNRVMVFDGAGCYATVGMDGGVQALSLAPDCMVVGTVAHEFMHTLGALHMHMRHDRDDYVKISLDSVPMKNHVNFLKPMRSIIYTPYEYGSNMQYPSDAICCPGQLYRIVTSRINPTPVVTNKQDSNNKECSCRDALLPYKTCMAKAHGSTLFLLFITTLGLLETVYCLSGEGKELLAKSLPGGDLEKRRDRLKHLGELFSKRYNLTATGQQVGGNESTDNGILDGQEATVFANESTGLSVEEINQREGVAEYLFDGDINLTE